MKLCYIFTGLADLSTATNVMRYKLYLQSNYFINDEVIIYNDLERQLEAEIQEKIKIEIEKL